MRASTLLQRPAESPIDGPPGHRWLSRAGLLVDLGPGLLAGTGLLQRVLRKVTDALERGLADLGAQRQLLPASEGEALVNLALRGGAAQRRGTTWVYALGAGFRSDAPIPRGLYDAHLYPRLDVVALDAASGAGPAHLADRLQRILRTAGLETRQAQAAGEGWELRSGPEGELLGDVQARSLGGGEDGPARVALLGWLDLYAVLGALADAHHDERGLCWPSTVAPLEVAVIPAGEQTESAAAKAAADLMAAGLDVLHDDRSLSAGEKRRDAELWGLPVRVFCGPTVSEGEVVVERRSGGTPERVELARLAAHVLDLVGDPGRAGGARRRLRRATY